MIVPFAVRDWLAFDAQYPAPTFFARPAWALALAYGLPGCRPYPVWVENGGERVLVPLVQRGGGPLHWREFAGMPMGTYTCAMREDGTPASAEEFEGALEVLARSCDALSVTPWPFAAAGETSAGRRTRHETAAIDLSNGLEQALNRSTGVSRRMAGQALRRGVECAPDRSATAASTYYAILREASIRWGLPTPPFSKELLEGLVAYGGDDVEIWIARVGGYAVAGGVILYGSQELFFWSAAMRHDFGRLRPSNALNAALLREAACRGLRWFNLGSSEGVPGVERFKRGLGAQTFAYDERVYERRAFGVYSRFRTAIRGSGRVRESCAKV